MSSLFFAESSCYSLGSGSTLNPEGTLRGVAWNAASLFLSPLTPLDSAGETCYGNSSWGSVRLPPCGACAPKHEDPSPCFSHADSALQRSAIPAHPYQWRARAPPLAPHRLHVHRRTECGRVSGQCVCVPVRRRNYRDPALQTLAQLRARNSAARVAPF